MHILSSFHINILQVVNHGILEKVLQRAKDSAAGFFELPFEEKKAYSIDLNKMQGYGRPFMVSEEEKLDWQQKKKNLCSHVQFELS